MTKLLYITNSTLFTTTAMVTAINSDERGTYVVLDQTIFYPQGGGQPADTGTLTANDTVCSVWDVRRIHSEVRHYLREESNTPTCSTPVTLYIDSERRTLNSRYHTAGHLLSLIVEKIVPPLRGTKGHQFPGEAYIAFDNTYELSKERVETIEEQLQKAVATNATVSRKELSLDEARKTGITIPAHFPATKTFSVCYIDGFPVIACGGTHVHSLQEIGTIRIRKYKNKKKQLKIYYEISDSANI